jgi:hypothetical protein
MSDTRAFSELTLEEQAKAMNVCALQFREQLNAHLKLAKAEGRPSRNILRSRLDLLRSIISDHEDEPKRRSFDQKELTRAATDIAFEMASFRFYSRVYNACTGIRPPTLTRATYQAMNYALLVHLRVLLGFFHGQPTNDDCCVEHFTTLAGFANSFSPQVDLSAEQRKELRQNLNRRLAHFSATRWEKAQPAMGYYAKSFKHFEAHVAAFENALPAPIRAAFAQATQRWDGSYGGGL